MTRQIMNSTTRVVAIAMIAGVALTGSAQEPNDILWGNTDPAGGNWSTGTNWPQFNATPEAAVFNEQGVINNDGLAFVIDTPNPVGGVFIGSADGSVNGSADGADGALEIRSGGSLSVVDNGVTSGTVLVGAQNGTVGLLTVERGGTLTTMILRSSAGDSSVTLGSGAGPGDATVTADATLFRTDTRVSPNVSFTTGELRFGGASNLITEIDGGNSVLDVTGFADLNGALTLDYLSGAPSVGAAVTILEAGAIARNFTSVTTTSELGPGLGYTQSIVPNGGNEQLQVQLEALLTLQVNRSTGDAVILSESGTSVSMTAYNLQSGDGVINTAYDSLEDQGLGGFEESGPAGLTATQAGELSSTGGLSVDGTGVELDSLYSAPATPAFGTPIVDDLGFTYVDDAGRALTGFVQFDSDPIANNLVLTIDPTSGDAQLFNDSETALDLDVYSIASDSGALLTTWDSLFDQGDGDWQEANPSANRLSELNPTGSTPLAAGGVIDLEGLWDTNGLQDVDDLSLEFRDTALGELDGLVVFSSLVDPSVPGDANGDGNVDLLDLDILGQEFGMSGAGLAADFNGDGTVDLLDLDILGTNFGTMSSAAVPEPTSLAAILTAIGLLFVGRRRVSAVTSTHSSSQGTMPMLSRFFLTAIAVMSLSIVAQAQPVTITGADTMDVVGAFTDGVITITPRDDSGAITGFGPSPQFMGPVGGTNANAINDADGDPSTTDDRDTLEVSLTNGSALRDIGFAFSRANPIAISGFAADPLATYSSNPGNGSLAYDASSGTLGIFYNSFTGAQVVIDFANAAATDGQTLLFEVADMQQPGPQLAMNQVTYDDTFALLDAGDVDGLNGVTIDDFNIILANFFTEGARADGDLTGDGFVSLVDFAQWESNFAGSSTGLAALLPTPEPSTAVLALLALALAGRATRR